MHERESSAPFTGNPFSNFLQANKIHSLQFPFEEEKEKFDTQHKCEQKDRLKICILTDYQTNWFE